MGRIYVIFLVVCVGAATTSGINPFNLFTSPDRCLTSFECPADKYCSLIDYGPTPWKLRFTCLQRFKVSNSCDPWSPGSCLPGSVCEFQPDALCLPIVPTGTRCGRINGNVFEVFKNRCKSTDRCRTKGSNIATCTKFTWGYLGNRCSYDYDDDQCRVQDNLYCNEDAMQCSRKKNDGELCDQEIAGKDVQCKGFCSNAAFGQPSRCAPTQVDGGLCMETRHCARGNTTEGALLCNVPRGRIGTCVREGRLLKRLGAQCKPSADACDARRGLSCWPFPGKGHVCQHRFSRFCHPTSKFSRCEFAMGVPTHCVLPPLYHDAEYGGYRAREEPYVYQCFPKLIAPLGAPCNRAGPGVICARGTQCRPVDGIDTDGQFAPLRFCVKEQKLGASCGDKFRAQCAQGLRCLNGTCVKGESPQITNATHADYLRYCVGTQPPCIPGTICENDFCRLPEVIVGAGKPCYDTATVRRKCATGLQCIRPYSGLGELACRKAHGVGGLCISDDNCSGSLKCGPKRNLPPFKQYCYDPTKLLKAGDRCKPNNKRSGRQCVLTKDTVKFDSGGSTIYTRPLHCAKAAGVFKCVRVSGLFEFCSLKDNWICGDQRLKCSPYDICIPRTPN